MPIYRKYSFSRFPVNYVVGTQAKLRFPQHNLSQYPLRWLYMAIATLILVAHSCLALQAVALDSPSNLELPSSEEIPEEVARTEIITEARSNLDGRPINAVEYAEEQTSLRTALYAPGAPQRFRDLVILLQVRRLLRPFLP
jgi:hypothetical protein